MKKKVLLKGALIVLIASILTRILGFFFRVFLANKLQAQGMGIYQLIISLYMFVVTFATSGISFAVSRIISENMAINSEKSHNQILKIAIFWALFVGSVVCFFLAFFKNQIAVFILREKTTTPSIFWLSFSIPFMAISCCVKGYFYAKRKPFFPSISSILEQLVKIFLIFLLFNLFNFEKISYCCALISISMTASEIVSCFFMGILYFKHKQKQTKILKFSSKRKIFNNILKISIPVQASTSFNAALKLIESVVIIEALKIFSGGDIKTATSAYGIVKGMVLPLIMFPTSFLQSIITILIPELSGATASGNKNMVKKACEKSLQLTLIMGIFISAIFIMFSKEIALILYKNNEVALILKKLSLLCPILYVQLICMGILNAIGEQIASMKYNILEGVLRIVLILTFVPKWGINAFLILMFIVSSFSLALYSFRLVKVTSFPICLNKILIKPTIAITISCFLCVILKTHLKNILPIWSQIIVFSLIIFLIYVFFLLCLGCLKKPEKFLKYSKS